MNVKKTLNILGVLLLIVIVVPFVIYAVPMIIGADHSFVVLTASMTPAIAPGDVVVVADRDPATVAEGDVITFTRGGNEVPVTHRVITVVDDAGGLAFETKGDANTDPDASLVPAGNVIGTVILTIPYIGYVVQFTNTPYGFIALVAGPIGLFIASELWTLYRRGAGPTTPPVDRPVENAADLQSEEAEPTASGDGTGAAITVRTLEGAIVPLLAFTVYSAYIAYSLPNELTISVVVAGALSLLVVSLLWLDARRGGAETPVRDSRPDDGADQRKETEAALEDRTRDGEAKSHGTAPDGGVIDPEPVDEGKPEAAASVDDGAARTDPGRTTEPNDETEGDAATRRTVEK